jgi:3-oxoacyl-[acyl-carrier-protein] synthase-3
MNGIGIKSIGKYVPEGKLTNADLEKMVDTNDEWIVSRTGIRERRIASKNVFTSDMAVKAAQDCLSNTGIKPGLVISSSTSGETLIPYQASKVAGELGLKNIAAFDINAACSGLIYAMAIGTSLMNNMNIDYALITASEKMSNFADYTDRASCILLGDGATSVLLSKNDFDHEIIDFELGIDASGYKLITMGSREGNPYFWQDGKNVFRFAVTKVCELIELMKQKTGYNGKDNLFIIPHQANQRIFEAVSERTKIPMSNFIMNLELYGNTSSASIGIALDEAWRKNTFSSGDIIFLIGFGAGLSWGSTAIRW